MSQSEQFEYELRVRYAECDPMRVAHHSVYPVWLEAARTEMLRHQGTVYRDMEAQGIHFVVVRMSLRYRQPARYDDLLTIRTRVIPSETNGRAALKIDHKYEILRDDKVLATARTTLACVDANGTLRPIPDNIGA